MGSYKIELKASAERDIRRLRSPAIGNILRRVEALSDDPMPRQSGKARKGRVAKVAIASTLAVSAVAKHGGFGCLVLLEISDLWDAIRDLWQVIYSYGKHEARWYAGRG